MFRLPPRGRRTRKVNPIFGGAIGVSRACGRQGGSVPGCFNQMIVEALGAMPFCRARLDATWRTSHQPEGEIDETLSWMRTAGVEETDDDKGKMGSFDRARIEMVYGPASRDP